MKVEYSKDFVKSVRKLSGKTLDSVRRTIQEVIDAPSPEQITNCRKLVSFRNIYRIRIGDLRAFFSIHIHITGDTVFFEYLISRGEAYSKGMIGRLREKDS